MDASPRRYSFGPRHEPDGRVTFRLWAPGVAQLGLSLAGGAPLSMRREADGWFALDIADAAAGTRYAFVLEGGRRVPDPASRWQPDGVHGDSALVAPDDHAWAHAGWHGRPWHETVIHELHVGCMTEAGTFAGLGQHLQQLRELGITALELMPVGEFAGERGWGYDGVLPYAPHHAYGRPDELKALIDDAHGLGLMVFLDVVYNHFGPEGNLLPQYCPRFFRQEIATPWGAAIDYREPAVRAFAIENALYWLGEFRFDGLRLDAVHAITDDGPLHLLDELAERVGAAFPHRLIHLILENERNEASWLVGAAAGTARRYDAQWNDDWHHALHVLGTGESEAYYRAFSDRPLHWLARSMASGFGYQGEPFSVHGDRPRGQPSGHLPPLAFVNFLQNHDQIGNRALGERLSVLCPPELLDVMTALLLLGPQVPMLFMGEEWGSERPFLFFCDFASELADAVRRGRRNEFKAFAAFADPQVRDRIPDPTDPTTFRQSQLEWDRPRTPSEAARLTLVRRLLEIRARLITPLLADAPGDAGEATILGERALAVRWRLGGGAALAVQANLGREPLEGVGRPEGALLFAWPDDAAACLPDDRLPPASCFWFLAPGGSR